MDKGQIISLIMISLLVFPLIYLIYIQSLEANNIKEIGPCNIDDIYKDDGHVIILINSSVYEGSIRRIPILSFLEEGENITLRYWIDSHYFRSEKERVIVEVIITE